MDLARQFGERFERLACFMVVSCLFSNDGCVNVSSKRNCDISFLVVCDPHVLRLLFPLMR